MRFVGWPVIAILILLSIQARSSRGLRFALGESEMHVETVHHRCKANLVDPG